MEHNSLRGTDECAANHSAPSAPQSAPMSPDECQPWMTGAERFEANKNTACNISEFLQGLSEAHGGFEIVGMVKVSKKYVMLFYNVPVTASKTPVQHLAYVEQFHVEEVSELAPLMEEFFDTFSRQNAVLEIFDVAILPLTEKDVLLMFCFPKIRDNGEHGQGQREKIFVDMFHSGSRCDVVDAYLKSLYKKYDDYRAIATANCFDDYYLVVYAVPV